MKSIGFTHVIAFIGALTAIACGPDDRKPTESDPSSGLTGSGGASAKGGTSNATGGKNTSSNSGGTAGARASILLKDPLSTGAIDLAIDPAGNRYVNTVISRQVLIKYGRDNARAWAATKPVLAATFEKKQLDIRTIATDVDGNILTAGVTDGVLPGEEDPYVLDLRLTATVGKFDPEGNLIWLHQISPAPNPSVASPTSVDSTAVPAGIAADSEGNVIIAGSLRGYIEGQQNATLAPIDGYTAPTCFVAKYTPAGNRLWVTQFAPKTNIWGMAVDGAGNTYVTGVLTANVNPDKVLPLMKLSPEGEVLWNRSTNGANTTGIIAKSIAVSTDGSAIYLAGPTDVDEMLKVPPQSMADVKTTFIALMNGDGEFQWARNSYVEQQDTASCNDPINCRNPTVFKDLVATPDGSAAYLLTDALVTKNLAPRRAVVQKFGSDGTMAWSRYYLARTSSGGMTNLPDQVAAIAMGPDETPQILGSTVGSFLGEPILSSSYNLYIAKIDKETGDMF